MPADPSLALSDLAHAIKAWGVELGFADVRIADIDLASHEAGLQAWLEAGFHGEMDYMASHGMKRARPAELVPGTVRAIVARMDYLPLSRPLNWREQERARQHDPEAAVVSVYARGRDYHKVLRARLQALAAKIQQRIGPFGYRVFTDSAPVMELPLAEKAGLGWRGKHTLLLSRTAGSTFFIGEILVDLALPVDAPADAHCGQCQACITACPTQAILGPGRLDARRCISYLTIELKGSIPEPLRPLIGNRIYGCDDCQLACPWNKFAQRAVSSDFDERHQLGESNLVSLFGWDEDTFNRNFEGSPIRRIGHEAWLRNLAVAMGNAAGVPATGAPAAGLPGAGSPVADAPGRAAIVAALQTRQQHPSPLVREHVAWALARHGVV